VDMVNSLPNVARQLARLGMVSVPNLQALRALCDGRDAVLGSLEAHNGLTGSPALGETAREFAPRVSLSIYLSPQGPAHPREKLCHRRAAR